MKFETKSEKETYNLGKKIAGQIKGGEVLALTGNLGAGKTVFTKGLAAGLGVKQIITSPTFVIMKVYKIKNQKSAIKNFIHIDCYRVGDPESIKAIGALEYFGRADSVVLVEWAERISKIIPSEAIKINLSINKRFGRKIEISVKLAKK